MDEMSIQEKLRYAMDINATIAVAMYDFRYTANEILYDILSKIDGGSLNLDCRTKPFDVVIDGKKTLIDRIFLDATGNVMVHEIDSDIMSNYDIQYITDHNALNAILLRAVEVSAMVQKF